MALRRAGLGLPAAVLAVLASLGPIAPAHAEGEIGLSADGVAYASTLTLAGPAAGRIVPGTTDTRAFLVRNEGPSAGVLSVDVAATDPDGLIASRALVVEAKVGAADWVPVTVGTTAVGRGVRVERLANTQVQVRAALAPTAGDDTQAAEAPFEVRLTLAEADAVDGAAQGSDDGVPGDVDSASDAAGLPSTGSELSPWTVWLGTALVGAGVALVLLRRRQTPAHASAGDLR